MTTVKHDQKHVARPQVALFRLRGRFRCHCGWRTPWFAFRDDPQTYRRYFIEAIVHDQEDRG